MRTRVSVYALATHGENILLTQLAAHCYRAGSWTLPGGGMDHGETPEQTLVREAFEETGLHAHELELVHATSYSERVPKLYMNVQLIYRVHMRGEPRVMESGGSTADVRWVPISEVAALETIPLMDEVLEMLAQQRAASPAATSPA